MQMMRRTEALVHENNIILLKVMVCKHPSLILISISCLEC